jgi:hypothetical protein
MRTLLSRLSLTGLLSIGPASADDVLPQPARPPATKPIGDFITRTLPDGRVLFRRRRMRYR